VVITDVASTKAALVAHARDRGLRFVGGHPMAGREASGYGAADADLFDGRPWVIVGDGADDAAAERVRSLALACRARPVELSAAAHDAAVAAISHLPLVVSAALVEAVAGTPDRAAEDWPLAASLAASGWRDMTRLAKGDVAMGAGIAATNAGPLAARVRSLRDVLDGWLVDLEAERDAGGPSADSGGERLAARLRDARAVLEASER
jgi:prephenate dehydrogenase